MRTSVTMGTPSRSARTPAAIAPGVNATSRTSPTSPEAWIMRRTTGHSTASNGCGPTSASMMRKLSARMSSGRIVAPPLDHIPARRHHYVPEAARLRVADDDGGKHINRRLGHVFDGGDLHGLPRSVGVAHDADRHFG